MARVSVTMDDGDFALLREWVSADNGEYQAPDDALYGCTRVFAAWLGETVEQIHKRLVRLENGGFIERLMAPTRVGKSRRVAGVKVLPRGFWFCEGIDEADHRRVSLEVPLRRELDATTRAEMQEEIDDLRRQLEKANAQLGLAKQALELFRGKADATREEPTETNGRVYTTKTGDPAPLPKPGDDVAHTPAPNPFFAQLMTQPRTP